MQDLQGRYDDRPVRQRDRLPGLRDRCVRMVIGESRIGAIEVRESLRENFRDDPLRIGRQRRGRQKTDEATDDVRLGSGLRNRRDWAKRDPVKQNVRTGRAIRLDQDLESRGGRSALGRDFEIDLDQHRGAADAHGRDRGFDLHVAVFRRRTGDKGDGALHQREQRGIIRRARVIDHFVEHHPRIRRKAKNGAVDEGDAERRIRSGLDDVAFFDVVAIVQNDRDAVAYRGRTAGELGNMTDNDRDARATVCLGELLVAGKRVDNVAGEVGAIGGCQRGSLLALEVIVEDQFAVIPGEDQINAGSLEITVEEQVGIRNDDGVRRSMDRR